MVIRDEGGKAVIPKKYQKPKPTVTEKTKYFKPKVTTQKPRRITRRPMAAVPKTVTPKTPKVVSYDFVGPVQPGVKRETKPQYQRRVKKVVPTPAKKRLERVIEERKKLVTRPKPKISPITRAKVEEVKEYIAKARIEKKIVKPSKIQEIMRRSPVRRPPTAKKPPLPRVYVKKEKKPVIRTAKARVGTLTPTAAMPTTEKIKKVEKRLLESNIPVQRALGEIIRKRRQGIKVNVAEEMMKQRRTGVVSTVEEKVATEILESAGNIPKADTPAQAINNLERIKSNLERARLLAESKGTPEQLNAINKMIGYIDRPLSHMKNMESFSKPTMGPPAPVLSELDLKQRSIEKEYGKLNKIDIIDSLKSDLADVRTQETNILDYITQYGPDAEVELITGEKITAKEYQDMVKTAASDLGVNLSTWDSVIDKEKGGYAGEYMALGLEGEYYGVAAELGRGNITEDEAEIILTNMTKKKLRESSEGYAEDWHKVYGAWGKEDGSTMDWSELKKNEPAAYLKRDEQGDVVVYMDYNKWYNDYTSTMSPISKGLHNIAGFIMGGVTHEDYLVPLIFEQDLEKAQQSSSKWVHDVATAGQRGDIIAGIGGGIVSSGLFQNVIVPLATAGTFSVAMKAAPKVGAKMVAWGGKKIGTTLLSKAGAKAVIGVGKVIGAKATPYVIGTGFFTHMGADLAATAALEGKLDEITKSAPGTVFKYKGKDYTRENLLEEFKTEMPTVTIAEAFAAASGGEWTGPRLLQYGGGPSEMYPGATRKRLVKLAIQTPFFIAGTRLPQSLGRMRTGWKAYRTGPEAWSQFRAMPEGHPIMGMRAGYQRWTARIRGKPVDAVTGKPIKDTFGIKNVKAKDMKSFGKRKSLELHPDGVNRRLLVQGKKPMTQQQWNQQNEIFRNFQKQFDAFSGHNAIIGAGEKTPSFSNLKAKIKTWSTGFKKTVTPKPKAKPFETVPGERAMVEWTPEGAGYFAPVEPPVFPRGVLEAGRYPGRAIIEARGQVARTPSWGEVPRGGWGELQPDIGLRIQEAPTIPKWEVGYKGPRATTLEKYGLDVGVQAKPTPEGLLIDVQQPYRTVTGEGLGVSRVPTYAEAQASLKIKPSVAVEPKSIQVAEKLAGKVGKQISLKRWELREPSIPREHLKAPTITRHIAETGRFGRYRQDLGRMRPKVAGAEKKPFDITRAPPKETVEIGVYKGPKGELFPYKKTMPDTYVKNFWKKHPVTKAPISKEVISKPGTVSVLEKPTITTTPLTKSLAQQRGVRVSIKKGVTNLQKLRQNQFKANLRKTELVQIKRGRYTEDITKLRSKVKKEIKLLESKPKLDTAELELIKHNKEILRITEPRPETKWVQEKPSYQEPTRAQFKEMQAIAEAERGVYDLSSYWKKARTGEVSLTVPSGQGFAPWSGRGTLARPVVGSRGVLTEPIFGKDVGEIPRTGETMFGRELFAGARKPVIGVLPKPVYAEDVAQAEDVIPALVKDTESDVVSDFIPIQEEDWRLAMDYPPYRTIREERIPKKVPTRTGGMFPPKLGVSAPAGGVGRGIGYRPGGYKERIHEVPSIWKAATTPRWGKPSEPSRPSWSGDSPTKKPKFFTLKK